MTSYTFFIHRDWKLLPKKHRVIPQLRTSRIEAFLFGLIAAGILVGFASGYGWCSEVWNWDGRSQARGSGLWPTGNGMVITYINGIFHTKPEWESITLQLQMLFGHEVRAFYNPSSGWWITDASKAGYHLLRRPANDTTVQDLGKHLAQAVEDVGWGRVLHIAHSGGALITYLAAQHHLTPRQRDKIDVLTFGGARSLTRKYFSGRVVNYYARNDPLVKLDRRAAELMKRLTTDSDFEAVNDKHNSTFVFLTGRARHFVQDHSLEGPTYQEALRKEASVFKRSQLGPLAWDYDVSLFRLMRKRAARASGMHYFFSSEHYGLRSLRKYAAQLTGLRGFFSGKVPHPGGQPGVAVVVRGDVDHRNLVSTMPPTQSRVSGLGAWAASLTRQLTEFSWTRTYGSRDEMGDASAVTEKGRLRDARSVVTAALPEAKSTGFWTRERLSLPWRLFSRPNPAVPEAESFPMPVPVPGDEDSKEVIKPYSYARMWKAWGLAPRRESSEASSISSALLHGSALELEEPSGQPPEVDSSEDENVHLATETDDKPWPYLGWTPWGSTRVSISNESSVSNDTIVAEVPSDVEDEEGLAPEGNRSTPITERFHLMQWWSSSGDVGDSNPEVEGGNVDGDGDGYTRRDVETALPSDRGDSADEEHQEESEGNSLNFPERDDDHNRVGGDGGISVKEEQSFLRWWRQTTAKQEPVLDDERTAPPITDKHNEAGVLTWAGAPIFHDEVGHPNEPGHGIFQEGGDDLREEVALAVKFRGINTTEELQPQESSNATREMPSPETTTYWRLWPSFMRARSSARETSDRSISSPGGRGPWNESCLVDVHQSKDGSSRGEGLELLTCELFLGGEAWELRDAGAERDERRCQSQHDGEEPCENVEDYVGATPSESIPPRCSDGSDEIFVEGEVLYVGQTGGVTESDDAGSRQRKVYSQAAREEAPTGMGNNSVQNLLTKDCDASMRGASDLPLAMDEAHGGDPLGFVAGGEAHDFTRPGQERRLADAVVSDHAVDTGSNAENQDLGRSAQDPMDGLKIQGSSEQDGSGQQ